MSTSSPKKSTPFEILSFWRALLSRRDWVYTLSLLIPFVVYSLALKTLILASRNVESVGQFRVSTSRIVAYGIWSDVFFVLGYALLWIGLFAAARKGALRWVVLILFHITTILVVLVKTVAYQYIKDTGTTLDFTIFVLWLPRFYELVALIGQGIPLSSWTLLVVALSYAALGPWLVTRLVVRWRGWPRRTSSDGSRVSSLFGSLVLGLLALGFGWLSLQEDFNPYDEYLRLTDQGSERITQLNTPLLRDPFVNLAVTGVLELQREAPQDVASYPALADSPPASLLPTGSEQRNVALILLESTRAQSTTPYNEDLETTPFLDELTENSLLAEQAYATVPYSTKANVAINCGIFSHPVQVSYGLLPEAEPGGIPIKCLPELLKDQGYGAAYFTPSTQNFENFGGLLENFGYDEVFSFETMDDEDFERMGDMTQSGLSGEEVVLKPSAEWLTDQQEAGRPFLATYLTSATHSPYVVPDSYQQERLAEDEDLNRYLNAIRLQDVFLENLFNHYKALGLYEDTVFIILGDHGEAFGEHGQYVHGNTPYEEALRIPLIFHDPSRFENGARVGAPASQLDILPTATDLLGYEIDGGAYQGSSLLEPLPEDRTLYFSCWAAEQCLASLKGDEKYIYHYGKQPDQLFDLSEDPLERENLADERQEEVEERRKDLLAWRSSIDATYRGPQRE